MSHKPGGGIASKQHVSKPVRYGESGGARKINEKGVSQIGSAMGNHVTGKSKALPNTIKPVRGGSMGGMGAVPLGNQLATNVKGGGPGTGREVMRSGSQGTHGPVNPGRSPERRDILSEFGPDKR